MDQSLSRPPPLVPGPPGRFQRAWEAYHWGTRRPLPLKAGRPDDNVRINYMRRLIDKAGIFLFGKPVTFELTETAETAAETWLKNTWAENGGMLTLLKLKLNGSVTGHAFLKILPRTPYPRLVVLDPGLVTVTTAPDDCELVTEYAIDWTPTPEQVRQRQRLLPTGTAWVILDETSSDGTTWRLAKKTPWPYPWPPLCDCQNLPLPNSYWGAAELRPDLIELNYQLNTTVSHLQRILRYHAHPKTWGKGFKATSLNVDADGALVFPSPDAELHNLEMTSQQQFAIDYYRLLKEALHVVASMPEVATGKVDNLGPLSGVALEILYQPLIELTGLGQLTYGRLLRTVNARLLELGGHGTTDESRMTTLHWAPLLPVDPLAMRQTAEIDVRLGVSPDTVLQRLGYNPDLERKKRAQTPAPAPASAVEADLAPKVKEPAY